MLHNTEYHIQSEGTSQADQGQVFGDRHPLLW